MSERLLSRLFRPLRDINVPRFISGSSLAFLYCLAFDRLVFSEATRIWRVFFLLLAGFGFPQADHAFMLAAAAVPTALVFRESLLAPGGMSLLFSIYFIANRVADELHLLKEHIIGRTTEQTQGEAAVERDKDWAMEIIASVHQLACWYLVPRADWVWRLWIDVIDTYNISLVYVIGTFVGIATWSSSGYWMPWLKGFHPRVYIRLVIYLHEQPQFYIYLTKKFLRRQFDRLVFMVAFGNCPIYVYQPLAKTTSEIRLLKLCGASTWDTVKAELVSVPISEAPPFEAISYRWAFGNEVPILLDQQKFLVSGEVHDLLRALRCPRQDRLLWLDSICIGQTSVEEKSWQIGFMTQIYSTSVQVIGWIAVMHQIPLPPAPYSTLAELGALNESADEFFQSFLHGDVSIRLRRSIIALCNEFFFRAWIIQEVALAQKLIIKFGNEEIMWQDFFDSLESFFAFHKIHASIANFRPIMHSRMDQAMENIRIMEEFRKQVKSAREKGLDGLPLSDLLLGSIDFEATNPRDRVFGLLGLSTTTARRANRISYRSDTTDMIVLINAVRYTIVDESSFLVLEIGGIGYLPDDLTDELAGPSWMPRWEFALKSYLKMIALTFNKLYKTTTWAPVVVNSSDYTSSVLHIQGVCVDKIHFLTPAWWVLDHIDKGNYTTIERLHELFSELLKLIQLAFRMAEYAYHPIYNNTDRRSLAWRTICHESRKISGDQSFDEDGRQVEKTVRDIQQQLQKLLDRGVKGTDAFDTMRLTSSFWVLSKLLPMQMARLCFTESGYFGVVPPYAKEGDQIWAFSGAPTPSVLRASLDSAEPQTKNTHQLVGVCYIDGIMHGELENAGLEPIMVKLV